jgi:eukaryotic-like serine/threonine-protein kinase
MAGPQARRQWLREAEAASLVRHPNVVTLYEVGEADDFFLLVLEYVAGGTLADRLSAPLPPATAARLMETIARAVHHIHRHGQLHLDLKPSNILLDGEAGVGWETAIPKVSDFGIARMADAGATDTGGAGAGGSPPYMAPEQIVRPRYEMSPAADSHALGAILYHLSAWRRIRAAAMPRQKPWPTTSAAGSTAGQSRPGRSRRSRTSGAGAAASR